jgi:hypothetical protein
MFSEEQQSVSNALAIFFFTLLFYWVDIVTMLDYTGTLSDLGWRGKNVVYIGGMCIGLALAFFYMPHASKILNDTSLASSQYRFFRYVFFCSPVVIFFALIFLEIRFPGI